MFMRTDKHRELIDAVQTKYPHGVRNQTASLSRAFALVVSQKEIHQDLFKVSMEAAKRKKAPNYQLIEF